MKYLNTQQEFINESNNEISIKRILHEGLMKASDNSHLVSKQIEDNIDIFLETLNVGSFINEIGDIKEYLGAGVFGAVFKLVNNKAMKITFDYREAPFLYEYGLKNRTRGLVKIDDIFKIKFGDTFAYIIIRDDLEFTQDTDSINSVITDLKNNSISEDIIKKYRDIGGLKYEIFLALKAMYDIDPNWRGTHYENVAIQNGKVVLYDGFSKNIKISDEEIPFLNLLDEEIVSESVMSKRSLEQLERIRKLTKETDIGDRVSDQSFPNQVSFHNSIDGYVQTYDEYMDEPFEVNQNVKNFKGNKKE